MNERDMKRIEAHLKKTFGGAAVVVKARPKIKDSAEVYVGDEFVGVVSDDEDEDGSFTFNMAILAEDLEG